LVTKSSLGKIKLVGIIASLAALALVLSPTLSALQFQNADEVAGQVDLFKADSTVVDQVSDQDLAACGSVNESIDEILGVDDNSVDDRKVASDTLVAEFCNRPVLIHEIMSSDHASMSLVAYACDASSEHLGTDAIQDSLSEHQQIYCDSAKQLIVNETNTFIRTVEVFRTEYMPLFEGDGAGSYSNMTSTENTLDEVTQSLEQTLALVDAGEYYLAALSFDDASKQFIGLFQEESGS
jgi:hypothetical protein